MNTLHYTKNNNTYLMRCIYPSGRGFRVRITKLEFYSAMEYVKSNIESLIDGEYNDNEVYYTEIKTNN